MIGIYDEEGDRIANKWVVIRDTVYYEATFVNGNRPAMFPARGPYREAMSLHLRRLHFPALPTVRDGATGPMPGSRPSGG